MNCARCGGPLGKPVYAGKRRTICRKCRSVLVLKRKYHMSKAAGFCAKCHRREAAEGRTRCRPCLIKYPGGSARATPNDKAQNIRRLRKRYAELRAQGLCYDCKAPSRRFVRCPACRLKMKERRSTK